ncbi:MAG: hypothetical protein Q4C50_08570 [Eubacteriales bacterium]|nr:hypothetical protein [Eubacteriales bacterium]
MIVLITMKISIHNPILNWLGEHTFEIYILQRIPMMILQRLHLDSHPYIFLLTALPCIFAMAYVFGKILHIVDRWIIEKFRKKL